MAPATPFELPLAGPCSGAVLWLYGPNRAGNPQRMPAKNMAAHTYAIGSRRRVALTDRWFVAIDTTAQYESHGAARSRDRPV